VVVMVGFGSFPSSISAWRSSASAAVIISTIFFLQLPSPTTSRRTSSKLKPSVLDRRILPMHALQVLASELPRVWKALWTRGYWTGNSHCTNSTTNPRKHSSKFALDPRFPARSTNLSLCSLHRLGQR
jgi:hypothetical protein